MVKLEEAIIARLEKFGNVFEVLVDPNLALDLKSGKEVNFDDLLAIDEIFKDAKKGEKASEQELIKVFSSTDAVIVAKEIILNGRVQLTTQQRKELLEQKEKELIEFISRNALNPQTKAPHPPARIENALREAKINVDIFKSVKEQVPEIIKEISGLIPISMEKLRLVIRIPAIHASKALNSLYSFNLLKQEWGKDGALVALIEVPAGLKADLLNKLQHITHGDMEVKLMEEKQ
ncbi:MAG: ribosome assembly factor SBDS [archaeon]